MKPSPDTTDRMTKFTRDPTPSDNPHLRVSTEPQEPPKTLISLLNFNPYLKKSSFLTRYSSFCEIMCPVHGLLKLVKFWELRRRNS